MTILLLEATKLRSLFHHLIKSELTKTCMNESDKISHC